MWFPVVIGITYIVLWYKHIYFFCELCYFLNIQFLLFHHSNLLRGPGLDHGHYFALQFNGHLYDDTLMFLLWCLR